jgi:hypothetical protein
MENAEGKRLMEWIEENGWEVLEQNKQGDEEKEMTAWGRVEGFKVGERADSHHLPLEITIEGTNHEEKGKGEAREEQKKVTIKVWDEQGVKEYRRRLEEATFEEQEVEKMAAELKEVIEKATTKKEVTVMGSKGVGRKNG